LLLLARRANSTSVDASPIIESLLEARSAARERRDFTLSDALRDALLAAGVEINDGADGTTWSVRAPSV
jgi:cysteinyl-tRNA synthetase